MCIRDSLGTIGAIGAFYSKKGSRRFMDFANQIPVVNAEVVTGFSICVLLIVVLGLSKDSFFPLIVGHVVLEAPFVYLSVLPKLKQMDNLSLIHILIMTEPEKGTITGVVQSVIFKGMHYEIIVESRWFLQL